MRKAGINMASIVFDEGTRMPNETAATDISAARQLRPLVLIVTSFSLSVAALLITTASLGASPIRSMDVAEDDASLR
jgi:hypothetical protein